VGARDVPKRVDHDEHGEAEGEADEEQAPRDEPGGLVASWAQVAEARDDSHHGAGAQEHEHKGADEFRDGPLRKSGLWHGVTSKNELRGWWSERGSGSPLPDPRSFQVSVASNACGYQRQTARFHWQ
jgi:hypothetical protein